MADTQPYQVSMVLISYLLRPRLLALFSSAFLAFLFPFASRFAFHKVFYDVHGVIHLCNLFENLLQFNLLCLLQWLTMDDLRDSA